MENRKTQSPEHYKLRILQYEALSKIPKRFIDGETVHTTSNFCSIGEVWLANPKYAPMIYDENKRKWRKLQVTISKKGTVKKRKGLKLKST